MADSDAMRARGMTAAVLAAVLAVGACSADEPDPEDLAGEAAAAFLTAWQRGEPTSYPAADRTISDLSQRLQIASTAIEAPDRATCDEEGICEVPAQVTHTLTGIGEWSYETRVRLERTDEEVWRVVWSPSTYHPRLTRDTTLDRDRELPERAPILGAGDRPLTTPTTVMRIGVVPRKARPQTYGRLADLLDIDAGALRQSVQAAQPDWFVPVITLRRPDYNEVRDRLLQVPGVSVDEDVWSLTKSSSWARALIGTVAPATEETLAQAGPLASSTDVVGASGLQLAFQKQLAGRPGGAVNLVDAESGATVEQLWSQQPRAGTPLRATIDPAVQDAAEAAVAVQDKSTALVAVRASTGEVLASAVGPGITSYNSAFVGQYPPGSTFKIVSAAALLDAGAVSVDQPVPCPPTTVVDGKQFKNYDDFEPVGAGTPTFAEDIAASCNTAVVGQAGELDDDALARMATRLGVGADWDGLGVPAFSGQVPVANSLVDRAASMIGQGRVLASPLAMAMVAAAVDSGQARVPQLVRGAETEAAQPMEPLDPALANDVRRLMRLTVTDGTASALNLPGEPVHAKTGTAEIDSDDPSKTHAWIIGYRGDVAFAVVVELGESGSVDAAPVVREFLNRL